MEIVLFDVLPSTQIYLIEKLRSKSIKTPICIIANMQTDGIGSRDNSWIGARGSLFASVALSFDMLPKDLPIQSASIYFGQIMQEVLVEIDQDIWLKWPNDLYLNDKKVGGIITNIIEDNLVCGIGVNLGSNHTNFASLDTEKSPYFILEKFLKAIEKKPTWKQILSNVKIKFHKNKNYFAHTIFGRKSLQNAFLCGDGSLIIDGERIYSSR